VGGTTPPRLAGPKIRVLSQLVWRVLKNEQRYNAKGA
jgi:hypothetical protein